MNAASLSLAALLACGLAAPARAQATAADLFEALAPKVPLDFDGDGFAELASLRDGGRAIAPRPRALVVAFVEPRLLALSRRRTDDPLPAALNRWCADVAAEQGEAHWMALESPPSLWHQDGLYVLALRRLLQAGRAARPDLAGALLVGHFPEALLVRTCNWRKHEPITLRAGSSRERRFDAPVPFLATIPELVAHRCETVLCDLDGEWEARYQRGPAELPFSIGVFPTGVPDDGGFAEDFELGQLTFEDFFHVDDGAIVRRLEQPGDRLFLDPLDERANGECSPADRRRPNPMSVPDILVSRLDARGVALSLHPSLRGSDGLPRAGTAIGGAASSWQDDPWIFDPEFELDLLLDYFARNHAYRGGEAGDGDLPASISYGLPSGFDEMRRAKAAWQGLEAVGLDQREADLCTVIDWLDRPALLRTLRAHSDPWGAVFRPGDLGQLERRAGRPWSFAIQDGRLVPSLAPACGGGKLDFFLLRTRYANRTRRSSAPSFYVHTGCEAISPPAAATHSFDRPEYGRRNGAESLLFLADGLALVGRAKVFYDEPRDFTASLGGGATFGEAWRRYFELESQAAGVDEVGGDIGRKRAYFWSVLGDWTLRLR